MAFAAAAAAWEEEAAWGSGKWVPPVPLTPLLLALPDGGVVSAATDAALGGDDVALEASGG